MHFIGGEHSPRQMAPIPVGRSGFARAQNSVQFSSVQFICCERTYLQNLPLQVTRTPDTRRRRRACGCGASCLGGRGGVAGAWSVSAGSVRVGRRRARSDGQRAELLACRRRHRQRQPARVWPGRRPPHTIHSPDVNKHRTVLDQDQNSHDQGRDRPAGCTCSPKKVGDA